MPARIAGWHHHVGSTDKEAAWSIKRMELLHIQRRRPRSERLSRKLVVGRLHKIGLAIIDKDFAPHIKRDHECVSAESAAICVSSSILSGSISSALSPSLRT